MKKLLTIAAMAFSTITASAQLQQAGTCSLMPKIGLGWSFFSDARYLDLSKQLRGEEDPFVSFTGDMSLNIGVEAQYMVSNSFGLSLGLEYQHYRTEEVKQTIESYNIKTADGWKLGYINLPILAQYHIGHFAIRAGIQPAFLVSGKYADVDKHNHYVDVNVKDDLKTFAFSVPVGVSYEFKRPFVLGLQYNIPCTKINKYSDLKLKSSALQLTFGYRFDL